MTETHTGNNTPAAQVPLDTPTDTPAAQLPADNPTPTEPPADQYSDEMKGFMKEWAGIVDGDDSDLSGVAKRFGNDPKKVLKGYKDLRAQLSSGEYKKISEAPSDDPEALAEWRKTNNVPEDIEGYKMPENLVIGEEDKEMVDSFLSDMHESNVPDGVPQKAVEWYFAAEQARLEANKAEEDSYMANAETAMREKYGKEYTAKINMVNDFVTDNFDEGFADGVKLSPEYVDAFVDIISQLDPDINAQTSQAGAGESIQSRLKELDVIMKEDTKAWFNNIEAQNEYKELAGKAKKLGITI